MVDIVVLVKYWKSQHSLKHKTQRHYYKLASYQHNFQETGLFIVHSLKCVKLKSLRSSASHNATRSFSGVSLGSETAFLG